MKYAVIVFVSAVLTVVNCYSVNNLQPAATEEKYYPADAVSNIKSKGYEIASRAVRDLFRTVIEEKSKSQASWGDLYQNSFNDVQSRAFNPTGSTGMNLAIGLGSIVLGLAGMGIGGQTTARSLKTAYDGMDWRAGVLAMTKEDFLDSTFDWMDIKNDACRKRMVCEVEQYAANQSAIKTFILKFLSKRHPSLRTYQDAVDAGLDYYDCAQVYPECAMSSVELMGNIPLERFGLSSSLVNAIPWKKLLENIQITQNVV
jgi:hypothetical protein